MAFLQASLLVNPTLVLPLFSLTLFSNVCRHHAARICEGEGHATQLVCPYHSWTYNLDGRLVKATRLKGIEGFSAAKVHLPSFQVTTWGPLVFVNLAAPSNDSEDILQRPLASQLHEGERMLEENGGWEGGEFPWRSLGHVKRRVYEIGCNWKVYSDNYLDGGYHIPVRSRCSVSVGSRFRCFMVG